MTFFYSFKAKSQILKTLLQRRLAERGEKGEGICLIFLFYSLQPDWRQK